VRYYKRRLRECIYDNRISNSPTNYIQPSYKSIISRGGDVYILSRG